MNALSARQIKIGTHLFWTIAALGFAWSVARNVLLLGQRWDGRAGQGIATIDFDVFAQAIAMYWDGQASCLYDRPCIQAAQKAAGFTTELMSWNYPPVIALFLAPFHGADPKLLYFALFGLNAVLAAACGWALARGRGVALAFAFEPVIATLTLGQTSLVTASLLLLATTLVASPERGERAAAGGGAALALLMFKPHMAWTAPFVAFGQRSARRRNTILISGAAVSLALIAASLAWPGLEAWTAFASGLSQAGDALAKRDFVWQQMPTPFVTLAALGAPIRLAYATQAAVAVAAAALVTGAWRTRTPADAAAITLIATALGSPYLYHYDLVCVGLGSALYLRHRAWTWQRGLIAYLTLLTPLVGIVQNDIGSVMGDNHWRVLPMAPMLLAVLGLTWRDSRPENRSAQAQNGTAETVAEDIRIGDPTGRSRPNHAGA